MYIYKYFPIEHTPNHEIQRFFPFKFYGEVRLRTFNDNISYPFYHA